MTLPNSTIAKILGTLILVFVVVKLCPLLILLALAILLACTLYPAIKKLEKYMPHWAASLLVTAVVSLLLVGTFIGIVPPLVDQFAAIGKRLPEMQKMISANVPPGVARAIEGAVKNPPLPAEHFLTLGQYVFGAISHLFLIMALGLYLAADGKRTYAWLRAFFSPVQRKKIDETADEVSSIIVAYVVGQFITSVLCSIFVFAVLQFLNVPAALVLAVLAGLFDVLPMLGFFIFTIPAVLFALTVSPTTALTVLILYVAYHLIENYLIVPRVYGQRLRLTDLVVLVSVLAGAYLAGIAGAILILPLVAAYPAFERIWLTGVVGNDVIEKHKQD